MAFDTERATLLALAADRDEALAVAEAAGAALRQQIRAVIAKGEVRPAEVARWLSVSPQYINKVLRNQN